MPAQDKDSLAGRGSGCLWGRAQSLDDSKEEGEMSFINIFLIEQGKAEAFRESLHSSCEVREKDHTIDGKVVHAELYIKNDEYRSRVKWEWILNEFEATVIHKEKQAWSVLSVIIDGKCYALTFGNAFYHVDKYSDKSFAFSIGRKFDYKKIKSTAQANPNSNRNKTVISYLKSDRFEYDSGESFIKIKGEIVLEEDFGLFGSNIEIGSSIKFDVEDPSLDKCLQILLYLNELITKDDITKIPIFVKVTDDNFKAELDARLAEDFKRGNFAITFSDFDIIGTQEVFYSASQGYTIKYKRNRKDVETINETVLRDFCEEKGLDFNEVALDLRISARSDSNFTEYEIRNLIDYTNEEEQCVLLKGDWYRYNDDYLDELDASMDEFEVVADTKFDWSEERYSEILSEIYEEEKDSEKYSGKSEEEVMSLLKRAYYQERAYNKYLEKKYEYLLLDRKIIRAQGQSMELADLYHEGCLIAVKIGATSSKLCYAVDQIDASAKAVKKNQLKFERPLQKVAVLMVLDRANELPTENGKVKLKELKLIVLKNRLNEWKSEMRHLGLEPVIYIGYRRRA